MYVYIEISPDFAEGCESFFVEVHPSFPVIDEEEKEIETVTRAAVRALLTLRSSKPLDCH